MYLPPQLSIMRLQAPAGLWHMQLSNIVVSCACMNAVEHQDVQYKGGIFQRLRLLKIAA